MNALDNQPIIARWEWACCQFLYSNHSGNSTTNANRNMNPITEAIVKNRRVLINQYLYFMGKKGKIKIAAGRTPTAINSHQLSFSFLI